jgi:hypothetical protein
MSISAATPIARDRRIATRYRTDLHVEIVSGEKRFHGRLVDVSRDGLCFVTNAQFKDDMVVEVSLPCMAFDSLAGFTALRGRVRHCNGRRTGIEFADLAPADNARILELLYRAMSTRRPF